MSNSYNTMFDVLRNLEHVDIVLATDDCVISPRIPNNWTLSRDLIDEHFFGARRIGVLPRLGSARSNFAVIRFDEPPGKPGTSLARARMVAKFLESGFPKFDIEIPGEFERQVETNWAPISSYIERTSFVDEDQYQLWVFLDQPVLRTISWLALKSALLAAEITTGVSRQNKWDTFCVSLWDGFGL